MADNHVCSVCAKDLKGQQHVKIVFENWPHEIKRTYRYRGQEKVKVERSIKEIVTALCPDCMDEPKNWTDTIAADEGIGGLINHVVALGKNPNFAVICLPLPGVPSVCDAEDCKHRTGLPCLRMVSENFKPGWVRFRCFAGHPGEVIIKDAKVSSYKDLFKQGVVYRLENIVGRIYSSKKLPFFLRFLFYFDVTWKIVFYILFAATVVYVAIKEPWCWLVNKLRTR